MYEWEVWKVNHAKWIYKKKRFFWLMEGRSGGGGGGLMDGWFINLKSLWSLQCAEISLDLFFLCSSTEVVLGFSTIITLELEVLS